MIYLFFTKSDDYKFPEKFGEFNWRAGAHFIWMMIDKWIGLSVLLITPLLINLMPMHSFLWLNYVTMILLICSLWYGYCFIVSIFVCMTFSLYCCITKNLKNKYPKHFSNEAIEEWKGLCFVIMIICYLISLGPVYLAIHYFLRILDLI